MSETLWQAALLAGVDDPGGALPPGSQNAPYTLYTYQGWPLGVARAGQPAARPVLAGPAAAGEGDEAALGQVIAAFSHFQIRYTAPAVALVDESGSSVPRVIPVETLKDLVAAALRRDAGAQVFKVHSLRGEAYTGLAGEAYTDLAGKAYTDLAGKVGIIPVTVYVCPDHPADTATWWVPAQAGQPVPVCRVHGKPLVPRRLGGG